MFRLYSVGVLIFVCTLAHGQLTRTQFTQLNEENGLAQNFVYGIVKDKRGFIWVSTGNGLTRFDGKETKIFTTADGLANDFITTSYLTQGGRILFGHFQGSISSYNGAFFETLVGDTLSSEVVSIAETKKGIVFCATRSKGFIILDEEMSSPVMVFPAELQGKIINQIKVIGSQLVAATTEGIYTFQVDGKNLIFNDAPEILLYEEITSLEIFKNDSLRYWAGTSANGLFLVRPGTFTRVEQHLFADDLENVDIRSIVHDTPKSLWLGTHQKGLLHLNLESDTIIKRISHFDEANGYPIFSVNTLYIEQEGTTWVGTLSNGMIKLHDPFFRFYNASGEGIEHVNAIAEGVDQYYVGTDKGLFVLNAGLENTNDYFTQLKWLKDEAILSLKFINGKLWIGTQNRGIQVFDEKENSLESLIITDYDLIPIKVRLFEVDDESNIWLAAMGEGALKIDYNGNVLKHLATNTGFLHNDIFAICADGKDNVWFGSLGAGLAKLDPQGKLHYLSQEDIFPSHDINDITEHNGIIWIATDGQGYFKYEDEKFTKVGPSQESESPFIKSLKADINNKIWIATRRSVGYLDLETGKSRYYDKNDGLLEKEDYASPISIDTKGNLLLANEQGVTVFNTTKIGSPVILDSYLTQVSISYLPYRPTSPTNIEMANGLYPAVILEHDQNHVTFDFRAIDINFTGRVYYRYYLEELEEKWSPPSMNNVVTYTSLDPGTYTFRAQATNDLRTWTDREIGYQFTINKPYWNTWWFYLLQITGIVALFGTTYILIRNPAAKRSLGRIMVFTCIFIVFDYLQNWLEPITPEFIGSVPLYKTFLNLSLALILFPVERGIKNFFKKRERLRELE